MSEEYFDWAQTASLLGDDPNDVPEDMSALVWELIQSSDERLQELGTKNPSIESKAISALAHQLRGSLLNFGFAKVGGILLEIEKGGYSSNEYPVLLEKVKTAFEASKKVLVERYPSIRVA